VSLTSPLSSPIKKASDSKKSPSQSKKSPIKITTSDLKLLSQMPEPKPLSVENYEMEQSYRNEQMYSPSYNNIHEETDKTKIDSKDKYPNLLPNEVFTINNYVRENLWRRAKILSNAQLNGVIEKMNSDILKLSDNEKAIKWNEISTLVGNNMNYRRAYANKLLRQILIGKFTVNCFYFLSKLIS
jgi:hypothetical protein